jgi:Ax21 family sulfation-dependent quorum factor
MKRTLLALALTAALPFAAQASDLSYTYIEGGYVGFNSDPFDADGAGFNASAALGDKFHIFGGYAKSEFDRTNIDIDSWNVGFGYNHELSRNADLLARAGYEEADVDGFGKADAWFTEVGVRGALSPSFEGWVLAGYEDGDGFDGEFYGKVGGLVKFNPTWGLSAEVKFIDGDQQYFVGPRISF